jgi:hypothetical protein
MEVHDIVVLIVIILFVYMWMNSCACEPRAFTKSRMDQAPVLHVQQPIISPNLAGMN